MSFRLTTTTGPTFLISAPMVGFRSAQWIV